MGVSDPVKTRRDALAARLTRASWLMAAVFALVFLLTLVAYPLAVEARGQNEGDLLAMTEDVTGVVLETVFALLLALPPVVGVIEAARALRRRVSRSAQAAAIVNVLFVLLALYQFVDAMRMSFWAPLD